MLSGILDFVLLFLFLIVWEKIKRCLRILVKLISIFGQKIRIILETFTKIECENAFY